MKRRSESAGLFRLLAAAAGLLAAGVLGWPGAAPAVGQTGPEGARRRPNLVFVMADDLGYGHLGCYGQEKIRTPNLDRLAREGTRFTQVYAGAPVCAPSRSVLMTGLHGGHAPVRANSGGVPLAPEDVTVAEVLRGAGYRTGLFGKWGLGDARTTGEPTRQGFDEAFGYLHQVHAHFYYPEYLWKNGERFPLPGNAGGRREQYTHDVIAAEALRFVRENRERPFFLYLALTIPHVELAAPEDSVAEYRGRFGKEEPFDEPRPGYADPAEPKATLAGMISRMDRSVGELMALLKELGLDRNTVVFFTSDNGAQGGYGASPEFFRASGPLRGYKGSVYEGGIRVPMLARWPGRIPAGRTSDHPWMFQDVLPTLAELAGAPEGVPAGIDGVSVVPTLLGRRQGPEGAPPAALYWEHPQGRQLAQAARLGEWKGLRHRQDGPLELYHLRDDPGETKNRAADRPEIAAKIEAYLKSARVEPRPQVEPPKPPGQRYR